MLAIAVEERILLSIANGLAELVDNVTLQAEGIVVEQFLRDLDGWASVCPLEARAAVSSASMPTSWSLTRIRPRGTSLSSSGCAGLGARSVAPNPSK